MYTHTHMHIHTHTYTYKQHMHAHTHTHIHTFMHVHLQELAPTIEVDESSDNSDIEDYIELHIPDNYLLDPNNDRGFPLKEDEISGCGQTSSILSPPVATNTLVQSFYFRLEHIILNIPDYPPAQIFTKYV